MAGSTVWQGHLAAWRWLLAGALAAGLLWSLMGSKQGPGQDGGGDEAVEAVQHPALTGQQG